MFSGIFHLTRAKGPASGSRRLPGWEPVSESRLPGALPAMAFPFFSSHNSLPVSTFWKMRRIQAAAIPELPVGPRLGSLRDAADLRVGGRPFVPGPGPGPHSSLTAFPPPLTPQPHCGELTTAGPGCFGGVGGEGPRSKRKCISARC